MMIEVLSTPPTAGTASVSMLVIVSASNAPAVY